MRHRRCYDEIIEYCNKLVYKGNLEPKRGLGVNDKDCKLYELSIPHFGHYQIDSIQSSNRTISKHKFTFSESFKELITVLDTSFNW